MIELRLSGGPTNWSPVASLGGPMSTQVAWQSLFPVGSTAEQLAGFVWHSCVYVRSTVAEFDIRAWVELPTVALPTLVELAWAVPKGVVAPILSSRIAVPPGITFAAPASYAEAEEGEDFAAGDWRALLVRYTCQAGSTVIVPDRFVIGVSGGVDDVPVVEDGELFPFGFYFFDPYTSLGAVL